MAGLEVRELEGNELHRWDALVAASAQGSVFHTSDWLVRNASLLNQLLVLLGCYEDEELIGGCPLFLLNPYRILKIASSTVVSVPYGGVVLSEIENAKQRKRDMHNNTVITALREYIVRMGFDYVNLVNSPELQDIRAFTHAGWRPQIYYTYVLPLDGDILMNASKDVRQNIRKAQKLGIESTEQHDPDLFWDLIVHTFAKQGREPPISKNYLVGLLDLIKEKNLGRMRFAKTSSGDVAAAEVTLQDAKMAHSWYAASSKEYLSTGAVSLLCYDIFTEMKSLNHSKINLMCGNISHLSMFSSGFNPRLVPYYGVEFSGSKYNILKKLKHSRFRLWSNS